MALSDQAAGAVVVGIDESEASAKALDWAADQAALEGRALTLVYATGAWNTPAEVDTAVLVDAMMARGRNSSARPAHRSRHATRSLTCGRWS